MRPSDLKLLWPGRPVQVHRDRKTLKGRVIEVNDIRKLVLVCVIDSPHISSWVCRPEELELDPNPPSAPVSHPNLQQIRRKNRS